MKMGRKEEDRAERGEKRREEKSNRKVEKVKEGRG
jgi:hypothetical protein